MMKKEITHQFLYRDENQHNQKNPNLNNKSN